MLWDSIVEQFADLLPPTPEGAGRASFPVRMMVDLLYLKYAYTLSDEQVLERLLESPYMQYCTGEVHFQHEPPCDRLSLARRRNWLDEAGAEALLARTIEVAKTLKAMRPRELWVVSIDSKLQEKNVAHPTDSRLLGVARVKLAAVAGEAGIKHAPCSGTAHRAPEGQQPHAPEFA